MDKTYTVRLQMTICGVVQLPWGDMGMQINSSKLDRISPVLPQGVDEDILM